MCQIWRQEEMEQMVAGRSLKILENHETNLSGVEILTKLLRLSDNLMRLGDIRPIWIFHRAHCEHVRHKKIIIMSKNREFLLLAYVIFISTCRALSDIKIDFE